jgi:methionyl-tRNA synthetase
MGIPVPGDPAHHVCGSTRHQLFIGVGFPTRTGSSRRYWPADAHIIATTSSATPSIGRLSMSQECPPEARVRHGFHNRGEKCRRLATVDPRPAGDYGVDQLATSAARVLFGQDGITAAKASFSASTQTSPTISAISPSAHCR